MSDASSTFKRAALFQACKRSSILSNIKFETASNETLVELVNQHNSHSIRELPILLSKVTVKTVLNIIVGKFPKLKTYVNADSIRVRIEDDELAYLISTPAKRQSGIVTIVIKNIAMNALGSSIDLMKSELLKHGNGGGGGDSADQESLNVERITINLPEAKLNAASPPSVMSKFGSNFKPLKRLDSRSSVRKRSRASSVASSSSMGTLTNNGGCIDVIGGDDDAGTRKIARTESSRVSLSPPLQTAPTTIIDDRDGMDARNDDDGNNNAENERIQDFWSDGGQRDDARNSINDDDDDCATNERDDWEVVDDRDEDETEGSVDDDDVEFVTGERRSAEKDYAEAARTDGSVKPTVRSIEAVSPSSELYRRSVEFLTGAPPPPKLNAPDMDFIDLVGPELSEIAEKLSSSSRPKQPKIEKRERDDDAVGGIAKIVGGGGGGNENSNNPFGFLE